MIQWLHNVNFKNYLILEKKKNPSDVAVEIIFLQKSDTVLIIFYLIQLLKPLFN